MHVKRMENNRVVRSTLIAVSVAIAVSGCSFTPKVLDDSKVIEGEIVDVDPDKIDRRLYGQLPLEETPPHVQVGIQDGITIEMDKQESEWHEQTQSHLQRWTATAINMNHKPMCVTPMWRLMEFEYTSFGPSEQLVPAGSAKILGEMHQRTWQLGDIWLAPMPSGYLHALRVRGTVPGAKVGEECHWVTPEDEIVTEPKEIVDVEI